MHCPHCDFEFNILVANGEVGESTPLLCEFCANVSLLLNGRDIRKMDEDELQALKQTPAWVEFIEPVQRAILQQQGRPN